MTKKENINKMIEETEREEISVTIDPQSIANEIKNLQDLQDRIPKIAHIYKANIDKAQENEQNKLAAERVITEVARMFNLPWQEAAFGMADLYQKGAHLKNVQNRSTYINGKTLTKANINQAMIMTQTKVTHRSLARAIRDTIYLSSKARNVPGNLFSQYKAYLLIHNIKLDEITLEEHSYYCTDFQIDNPNIPLEVARFLTTRTRTRNTSKNKK